MDTPNGAARARTFPERARERERPGLAALTAAALIEAAPQLPDGSSALGRELCIPFDCRLAE